jgi:putative transposase
MCLLSHPYPSDLSDREWEILAPLIPPAKPGGRPRKWPMQKILNAVFYVLRSGCQWRLLPRDFPPWSTVHHYFRMWRLDGTWEKINAVLRERIRLREGRNPQPSGGILDSQSVKTTRASAACAATTEPRNSAEESGICWWIRWVWY